MPRKRQVVTEIEHADVRLRPTLDDDEVGNRSSTLRHQIAPERVRLADGGRQAGRGQPGGDRPQSREVKRKQVAALGGDEGVQLVEHDALQAAEELRGAGRRQHERELLGGGHEDVRRPLHLPLALGRRRVARTGLDADGEVHLAHRSLDVTGDVDRERFQGRDVEGVQPPPLQGS